jgi:ABC-2 type transport system permease protein
VSTLAAPVPAPTTAPRTAPGWPVTLRAIVARGLRDQRRSTLTWGLSLGAYGGFMTAIYPSIQDSLQKVVKSYPSALKKAFSVTDLSTVEAYVHAELFSLIVPLALAFFTIRIVGNAIAGAEQRGDLDTTLSLPLPRRVLVAGTFIVAAVSSLAVMTMTGVLTFAVGRIAGTGIDLGLTAAGVLGVWPIAVLFAGVAALACGALRGRRSVTGLAMGTLVAMYVLDLAGRLAPSLGDLRYASVFRYYGAPMRDGLDVVAWIGILVCSIAATVLAAALFDRRDLLH